MHTILIVSGNQETRQELLHLLPWSMLECTILETVKHGNEALAYLRGAEPDFLFLDLGAADQMSTALLRFVEQAHYHTKIITLTGPDSPGLLGEENHVFEQLAKPVNAENLASCVLDAIEELTAEYAAKASGTTAQVALSVSSLCEDFIRKSAMFGCYDQKKINTMLKAFHLYGSHYRLAVIEVDNVLRQPGYNQILTKHVLKKVFETSQKDQPNARVLDYQLGSFLLLLCYQEQTDRALQEIEGACRSIQQDYPLVFSVGVSGVFTAFSEIAGALLQAQHALEMKFYADRGLVFLYEGINLTIPAQEIDKDLFFAPLIHSVNQCDPGAFLQHLDALTAAVVVKYQGVPGGIDESRKLYVELATRLLAELHRLAIHANKAIPTSFPYVPILYADGIKSIKATMIDLGLQIIKQIENMRPIRYDYAVTTILQFMSKNYAEEITLEQIAALVYMNASYVSRLLKKETGKNFTDLLLELRLEKAKELLRTTPQKVYEIGESVGIVNAKYFSQVFKKYTGLKPSEYREFECSR